MKMVKSLLLISAACAVGFSGAQAADLPVKAKPVEYVKVCSLYGVGFYYIPGTDICMKIGGYIRYQVGAGASNISFGPFTNSVGFNSRNTGIDVTQRVRAVLTQDTRQQTAYGTLRTYLLMGFTHDSTGLNTTGAATAQPQLYANRGFIQLAGFTFGKATSFFDFASTAAVAYNAGFVSTSDTGDSGQIVGSYTAQFGNGLSGTIGIEQSKRSATALAYSLAAPAITADNLGGFGVGAASRPDIVGNLRLDQAWGSAQIMGALHDVSAAYFGAPAATVNAGHPDGKWGWAVGAGLKVNFPMIGPGDYFQAQVGYSEGAAKFVASSGCGGAGVCLATNGASYGFGFTDDATLSGTAAAPGTFNLTTAWGVFASYEHFWTPALRTSLYGSYLDVSRNRNGNAQVCGSLLTATQLTAFNAGTFGCDMDFQTWQVGSRSQWNVTKDFYVGLDVIYSELNSAKINGGNLFTPSAAALPGQRPAGGYQTSDQDQVSVTWRVHRDIAP